MIAVFNGRFKQVIFIVYFNIMKPSTNCFCWFLFTAVLVGVANAQPAIYNFEHITSLHGLSNNKVEAVIQDREGFYWIATQNGLNRFNGSSFKVYYSDIGDSTTLTDNHCNSLLEDRNGNIWVTTNRGVSLFIKKTGQFQQIYLSNASTNFERENRVNDPFSDADGNIWFYGLGLWKYDIIKQKLFSFHHHDNTTTSLSDNSGITNLIYDKLNNGIWVFTWYNINFFDFNKNSFYHKENNPEGWKIFEHEDPGPSVLDKKNQLWFQDIKSGQLAYFNIGLNKMYNIKPITKGIRALLADDKNRIWICYWLTKTEIYDQADHSFDTGFFTVSHPHSAVSEKVTNLYIDKNRNYWITSGEGISIYNENNQFYKLFKLNQNTRGAENELFKITAIEQTDNQHLWVGSNQGLFKFNLTTQTLRKIPAIGSTYIRSLSSAGHYVWLAYRDYVVVFDVKKERVHKIIPLRPHLYFIGRETEDIFWVALKGGAFYKINKNTYDTLYFFKDTKKPNHLIVNSPERRAFGHYNLAASIKGIHEISLPYTKGNMDDITKDNLGNVWFRSYGAGIFRYNVLSNKYRHYGQTDGLSSNFVNSMVPDKFNNIWISTSDGINYLKRENEVIFKTGIDFIFPSNDNINNKLKGINDRIYFFCGDQIAEIDPSKYHQERGAPRIVISSFKIFEKEKPFSISDPLIELSWEQNFFSFEYSVLKTNPSVEQQYAYMLEGFDKSWNYVGDRRYANYTNVPGGTYHFKIKAKSPNGKWSNVLADIAVTVHPPFWKTAWFIFLSVLVIAAAIYILFRYRINELKKVIKLRNKISQDLHDEVASTLSGIRLYSEMAKVQLNKNDILKVQDSLEVISLNASDMSKDMNDIIWTINPANDNLKRLLEKLKNYARELTTAKKISFEMNESDSLENEKLNMEQRRNIYLICKEAVNNSVKYADSTKLKIDVVKEDNYINIIIKDNGAGFNTLKNHDGNGLKNMRERAQEIKAYFELISEYDHGTEIMFRMRL